MRIDPAPSVPWASTPMPATTAAAAPPLEPPGVRPCRQGLWVGPTTRLPESPFQPISGVFVLPSNTMPASRRRSTRGASKSGIQSAVSSDPRVVRIPRVAVRSFSEPGMPARGGGSSAPAKAASAARASAKARSGVTVMKALSLGIERFDPAQHRLGDLHRRQLAELVQAAQFNAGEIAQVGVVHASSTTSLPRRDDSIHAVRTATRWRAYSVVTGGSVPASIASTNAPNCRVVVS